MIIGATFMNKRLWNEWFLFLPSCSEDFILFVLYQLAQRWFPMCFWLFDFHRNMFDSALSRSRLKVWYSSSFKTVKILFNVLSYLLFYHSIFSRLSLFGCISIFISTPKTEICKKNIRNLSDSSDLLASRYF